MNNCYQLKLNITQAPQSLSAENFIGGVPKLPRGEGIPKCKLCGAEETFFFQLAFPSGSAWNGLSLAVFACTSCVDENTLIPEMLQGPLNGVDIPEKFLEIYQKNFRFIIFETTAAILRENYQEKVKFKLLHLNKSTNPDIDDNKIYGNPNWLLGNESPKSYDRAIPMFFLVQLLQDFQFEINNSAKGQMELGLNGSPQPSSVRYYQLFNGNKIFLFGTEDRINPLIYVITQVD